MDATVRFLACALGAFGLLFFAGGCGGGGASDRNQLFAGSYALAGFAGQAAALDVATAQWGGLSADGAGYVTGGTTTGNQNSVIVGPMTLTSFPYRVAVGGRMTWRVQGVDAFLGGVSSDGALALVAAVHPDLDPQVLLLGRKQGAYSDASLAGVYHLVTFFYASTAGNDGANWGTVAFDGAGTATFDVSTNTAGTPMGPASGSNPYAVAADGTLSWILSTVPLEGGIVLGGDAAILAGASSAASLQILAVLVRAGTAASAALLAGSYHVVGLVARTAGAPEWESVATTGTADGSGALALSAGTANRDRAIVPSPARALGYAVAPSGALAVDAGARFGAVAPGGGLAVYGGGAGDVELWVWFR